MPNLRAAVLLSALLAPGAACPGQSTPPSGPGGTPGHENLHAVLWTQHAAEHEALCRQAFNAARVMLDAALADPSWTACVEQVGQDRLAKLPTAVVVDVDETVLDNSAFQGRLIVEGGSREAAARGVEQPGRFTSAKWAKWCEERQASPVPGALAFLQRAASLGVTVFYVTNRDHSLEAATRANLAKLGFPIVEAGDLDVVLTRGERDDEPSSKTPRRRRVAGTHRVLMMFGDDLGDFLGGVKPELDADASSEAKQREAHGLARDRRKLTADFAGWWGTRWFVLPNPMYGSWERIVRHAAAAKSSALVTRQRDEPRKTEPRKSSR